MTFRTLRVMAVLLALLAFAMPASAQVFTGRIEVTVEDSTGARLPGVTIDVSGPAKITLVTDARGEAHFLGLSPGTYQVKATLQGFNDYSNTAVAVNAGVAVPLSVKMSVAGTKETVEVTAETPVIDNKKTGTGTTVTLEELQNIPSARDPWVVMQTVPGIIVDRVNIGGSESGQQSGYQAKGSSGADATWNMDGIPITDMAATGSTPTYYDFDMFQEMNVTTGGSDMGSSTGGVHLNFILKSGTNAWHGSARTYFEDQSMQGNNMDPAMATRLGSPNGKGNRTSQYADYGFEIGGPIVKDRLWAWGSLGKTDVRILTLKQTPDRTILKNRAFKTQGQVTSKLRASFTYFFGDKNKFGRDASSTRPPETTLNQKGPSSFYKGELDYVAGNNLFLAFRASQFPTGFSFDPQGGMNANVYRDYRGNWHGSYWNYFSDRPQQTVVTEGSYFHGKHEVKFGFSWRRVTVDSTSALSTGDGHDIWTSQRASWPTTGNVWAYVASPWASSARAFYTSAWLGDTITMNRLTINAGLRIDHQTDGTLATSEAAVPGFETLLPAITAKPVADAVTWNSISPRINVTYAVDEAHKTLLRASYAKFSSQLPNGISSQISPVQYRYLVYGAVDANRNGMADYSEVLAGTLAGYGGFDINNPASLTSINQISGYSVPTTHEFIVGIDHELMPNFGVSGAFTYRKMTNFNWYPRIGVNRAMYTLAGNVDPTYAGTTPTLPDGSSYSSPYFFLDPAKMTDAQIAAAQGTVLTTHPDYYQRFVGFELQATKRMSNRWMARVGFSNNVHRQYWTNTETGIMDPTPGPSQPYENGGLVITASGGSGKSGIYQLLPKYQLNANGLFQAPAGVDLGFNMLMRQGFGQPWFESQVDVSAFGDPFTSTKSVALYKNIDTNRLPAVTTFDLRVGWNPAKVFNIKRVGFNIDFDIFNLFNSGTVLGRQYDVTYGDAFNQTLEIMNPRIARLGVRLTF